MRHRLSTGRPPSGSEPVPAFAHQTGAIERIGVTKWPKVMLTSAVTSVLLIYGMTSATEVPSWSLAAPRCCLLACALIGLVGFFPMYA
jgi:hypothetical protein